MAGLTAELTEFLDGHRVGVLATIGDGGKPRQSVVYRSRRGAPLDLDRSKRLKAHDVWRSGWGSLCVLGHERPYPSAVFSGPAEILANEIGPATAAIMQRIGGMPEAPPPQTDQELAAIDRVILAITIEAVTAVNYLPSGGGYSRLAGRRRPSAGMPTSSPTDAGERHASRGAAPRWKSSRPGDDRSSRWPSGSRCARPCTCSSADASPREETVAPGADGRPGSLRPSALWWGRRLQRVIGNAKRGSPRHPALNPNPGAAWSAWRARPPSEQLTKSAAANARVVMSAPITISHAPSKTRHDRHRRAAAR